MDALCLFETGTHRIVGVNASWTALFGYPPSDMRGMSLLDLTVSDDELLSAARAAGSRQREESAGRCLWRRADGSQFMADFSLGQHAVGDTQLSCLLISELPIVDWGSRPSSPVADDESADSSAVPTRLNAAMQDRMARCARQQAALLRLASAEDRDYEAHRRHILREDAQTLDVARVSFWALERAGDSIVCEMLYDQAQGTFETKPVELFARDFPTYFKALVTGTLIPAHRAASDPRTSELVPYMKPLGIGALLDVPVYLRGELIGVLCHEHIGPERGWTLDEQQFAMSIGQMFSLAHAALHREDASRSLRQRDSMLKEANAVLERAMRPGDGALTGRVIKGYRMGEIIGRGGMGEVYRAERAEDGLELAIKLLSATFLDKPEHVQRFFREARITAAVPSEHVARVFEVGTFEQDMPFIAMEMLEGHDLGWHLRRSPQLPLEQVVELVDHAARALAAVREAGVVHRDLKPSNLFLVDALPRAWKVLDFGLSRSAMDPFTTTAEDVVGTPAYMAPEQLSGAALDHRTDQYALGAIAYRALTGRPPFEGDLPHILYSVLTDPLTPIASLVRGIPVDVELVLVIALAKDPEERFPAVEQFAGALREAAVGGLDDAIRAWGWKLLKRRAPVTP